MKILIADDDLTSRIVLQKLTESWGLEPIVVENGEAAWGVLQAEDPPRIILLDWEMPVLDGLQLSRRIREHNSDDPPYIILLTGRNEATDIATGLAAGANDYVNKPFKKVELEARIKTGQRLLKLQYMHLLALAKSQLAASVFTHTQEGIIISDPQGIIVDVNRAFSDITGYSHEESLGKNSHFLATKDHEDTWKSVIATGKWSGENWSQRKNGDPFYQHLTITAVYDEHGKLQNYISLFSDRTKLAHYQEKLAYAATHDGLTKLANRSLLIDHLQQAMAQVHRGSKPVAVVYIDLDGFKAVNDSFGHAEGDKILISVAKNFNEATRDTDTVSRVGGDEFIILLTGLTNNDGCDLIISRLLAAATSSIEINGVRADISASIGIRLFADGDSTSSDELLQQADRAMYQAKNNGKNCCQYFDDMRLV